jgi:Uma2 family endonuclease
MGTNQAMKKLTMEEFAELSPEEQERRVRNIFHRQIGQLTRFGVNPDLVSNAMFICALKFHAKENGWIRSCEMVRQALDTVEPQTAAHAD